jgi:hypothetical protein
MKINNSFLLLISAFTIISFASSMAIANDSLHNDQEGSETNYDNDDTYDNSKDTYEYDVESEDAESSDSDVEEEAENDTEE